MAERPILILATGQRCGSTWLQRALTTHPGVFIWGEHGGALDTMLAAADTFAAWSNDQGALAGEEFEAAGTSGFMANLAPTEAVLREQVHAMIRGLFRRLPDGSEPAGELRWGFKEVRYGAAFARRFTGYFPEARVIHLTRDPISVLRSLGWWELTSGGRWKRERTVAALHSWRDINGSFLDAPDLAGTVLPIRYEDLTGDRAAVLASICAFLDLDVGAVDHGMLDDVVHAPAPWGRTRRRLAPRDEVVESYAEHLEDPDLIRVAAHFGYPLTASEGR
ncbi:hypothetical protein F4553_007531 [Allocatelliglobosispora scoriae]|uniref:Sulfotransferase n=1 Tax=Allocatelliglobosispora scoriae TaxID=643052 RepID=A0A841BY59_9ACTN|nr:sulfotransferase [Allocatelliglobosispora scoriae]MBB5874097.1 hypothetical protein [Allocatelliglobosispora scoriae]